MGINLDSRKIKGTPYKVVIANGKMIGMFDHDKYVGKTDLKPKHLTALAIAAKEKNA